MLIAEEVFVPKRKLELIFKMYLLYFKVYFKFVFHTLMGVHYIPVVCITYQKWYARCKEEKHTKKVYS